MPGSASPPDTRALLDAASRHVFSAGVGDVAEALCTANMARGLAKVRWAEARLGLSPSALFVGAPDATVTRNRQRWSRGFGYGGVVSWSPEIAVLDALPNGCGMLVSELEQLPPLQLLQQRARELRERTLHLDGVAIGYDLDESNHFVDGCELAETLVADVDVPRFITVIHSSGQEHRAESPFGVGLYIHESRQLAELAERVDTPWGEVALLSGATAERYYAFCQRVQRFNRQRRQLFASELFGEHRPLVNATHQGFRRPGLFHLGSYWYGEGADAEGASSQGEPAAQLLPLTLGPDQPVYLLRPLGRLARAVDALGWRERANELGVLEQIESREVLPHGGGYGYPQLRRLVSLEHPAPDAPAPAQPHIVVETHAGQTRELDDIRALPFSYRGAEVLERTLSLGLAEVVARYDVRYVVK